MTEKEFKIKCKWNLDNGGSIYQIRDKIFFYNTQQDPQWNRGQELSREEILATKCYKQKEFKSWDDIPNNCAMAL